MSLTHFQYVAYRRIDLEKAISGRPIGPLLPLAFAPTFRCDQYAHTHILNFKQLTFCYVVRPTSAVFPLLFLGRLFSFFFCEISRTSVDSCKAKQIGGQEIGSTFQLLGPSHRSPCSSRTAELLRQFANLSVGRFRPRSLWPFCQFQSGAFLKIESKSNTLCGMKQARR